MPVGGRIFLWLASIVFSTMPIVFSVAPSFNDIKKLGSYSSYAASANEILFLSILIASIAFIDCAESVALYFNRRRRWLGTFVMGMLVTNVIFMLFLGIYYGQLFTQNQLADLAQSIIVFAVVVSECFVCRLVYIWAT